MCWNVSLIWVIWMLDLTGAFQIELGVADASQYLFVHTLSLTICSMGGFLISDCKVFPYKNPLLQTLLCIA